jgi:Catalase
VRYVRQQSLVAFPCRPSQPFLNCSTRKEQPFGWLFAPVLKTGARTSKIDGKGRWDMKPKKPKAVDIEVKKTKGGETHQQAGRSQAPLTTNQGLPVAVADDQNSLRAGKRGPGLLEDFVLREKITHFDHERTPERIVHARGAGAHGYFQPYLSMRKSTKAAFLSDPKVKTQGWSALPPRTLAFG